MELDGLLGSGISPVGMFKKFRPTVFSESPLRAEIFTRDEMIEHAKQLARRHRLAPKKTRGINLIVRFEENDRIIEKAYFAFAQTDTSKEQLTPGAEWLLDNYHVIEEHVRDIKRHLPKSYYRDLPKLLGDEFDGYPRVYQIAQEAITHSDAVVDLDLLSDFVRGYQSEKVLSIGELWAVPIMLRLALIENLRRLSTANLLVKDARRDAEDLIDEVLGDESRAGTDILLDLANRVKEKPDVLVNGAVHLLRKLRGKGLKAGLTQQWLEERLRERGTDPEELIRFEHQSHAANQISIGNTVTSLKTVSSLNWRNWFENLSQVHALLIQDPAKVYAASDFVTRDKVRHVIENLSRYSGVDETRIAATALKLAEQAELKSDADGNVVESTLRVKHIGYYLIDDGLAQLEKEIAYEPAFVQALGRTLFRNALTLYTTAIFTLTVATLAYLEFYLVSFGLSLGLLAAFALLALVPASHLANDLVQWIVTHIAPPSVLAKLDFEKGIPDQHRTLVAVHAIFNEKESIRKAVEQLEVRYLGNDDPNLYFALLADLPDASQEHIQGDRDLIGYTQRLIENLNTQHERGSVKRFFVLFRDRKFNPSEGKWMGWERKRGKIMELNRLILGAEDTSFIFSVYDAQVFRSCKYVITLDSDSQLPRGVAQRLVGTIAHPLNRPIFDVNRRLVVKGYGIIQPRVGVSLGSANASLFARILSGHAGLDPYTSTVSDVYQDLFGRGSYVGKAIYDVDAFEKSLGDRVPENALLSHDLFEGLFARTALATDIELLDEFPSRYNAFAKRQHRWVRGDWQLLPWIFGRVPNSEGSRYKNPISALGRWQLDDNLRRSLLAPTSLLFLVLSWLSVPAASLPLSLFIILVVAFPLYANLANALVTPPLGMLLGVYVKGIGRDLMKHSVQVVLAVSFLAYQSYLMTHAILVTLFRLLFSKRHLLEWETAYSAEKRLGTSLLNFTVQMFPGTLLTGAITVCLVWGHGLSMPYAWPILSLWFIAPILAWYVSQPLTHSSYHLQSSERDYLTRIAWDTWRFFEQLMVERHNYLVPDNIQLVPSRAVAERTSPTNVGLALLCIVSANDFGFIPLNVAVRRISNTFETLKKLEKFRGHFLNWYQTVTLQALYPRYVSVVDSGNFLANLVALRVSLKEFQHAPVVTPMHWEHLARLLNLISDRDMALALAEEVGAVRQHLSEYALGIAWIKQLTVLVGNLRTKAAQVEWLRSLAIKPDESTLLASIFYELEEFEKLDNLFSWYETLGEFTFFLDRHHSTLKDFPGLKHRLNSLVRITEGRTLSISLLLKVHRRLGAVLQNFRALNEGAAMNLPGAQNLVARLEAQLISSTMAVEGLAAQISTLIADCNNAINEADFKFLYDERKNVFVIGYNVDEARLDNSYYDLLASECRIASLLAIATGQVPQKHWFALGRGLTDSPGGKALLSWSGTMFEYLMPILLTKDYPGTILSETYQAVVRAQQIYGKRRGVPWGVSESGYSGVDFERTYQYYAFGVPGLGLKRGLSEDLVISPYSSFLALPISPKAAIENIRELESEKGRGEFGFFEAIDFTPERLTSEERNHVVMSFLAHHQGMSLVSIDNFLNRGIFQNRFHADPTIRATELLLHERFPHRVPSIVPHQAELSMLELAGEDQRVSRGETLTTPHTKYPRTRLLSNGRYSVFVDNAGSGMSVLDKDVALTRWREDAVKNDYGYYIFVRDLESNKVWSVAYQPTLVEPESYEVIFNPDKIEFKRRDFGILLHTEITISPEDNVEVRRVTLKNLSSKVRKLEITSYAEVVLGKVRADLAHPAFAKMFIQSEFVSDYDALLFSRRPRSVHEERLYLLHMLTTNVVWERLQFESSRANFIGRGRNIHDAAVFEPEAKLGRNVGPVLDPIFSLRTTTELMPGATEQVSFLTAISNNREELLHTAKRYHEVQSVTRAFEMAWSQSNVELRHEQITIAQTHVFQRLANAIIFNVEHIRGEADSIARNRLAQSGFWRFGISGDFPIVFIRIGDPAQIKTVQEALLAHWYLRLRGLVFDLVVLNEYPGGYLQTFHEELEALIKHGYSASMAEKHGGVYLRKLGQLSDNDVALVQAFARVVVNTSKGSLAQQLSFDIPDAEPLKSRKALFSYVKEEAYPEFVPKSALEMFNGFGGFSDNGSSYSVIVKDGVFPPLPWCNVVSNPNFGFLVSEAGGGYTWSENSRENRLTPWSNDPVSDHVGEALYIRDSDTGVYWSATPRPVPSKETYLIKHAFGFSQFDTQIKGIQSQLVVSSASSDPVKWWTLKLKNTDLESRHIEVFLYLEWVLGIQREESIRNVVTDYDSFSQTLFATNHYNNEFAGRFVVVGTNQDLATFTTSREEFLGRNREPASPYALESVVTSSLANLIGSSRNLVSLSGKVGAGLDSCAALGVQVALNPGEEKTVLFFMGESRSVDERKRDANKFRSLEFATQELEKSTNGWKAITEATRVSTPDRSFDLVMNGWLLYQALGCRIYGRSAFYQSGGAFGFRDQLQDALSLLYSKPELVRNQILVHAARQFVEGDVQHWWHPPTGRGVRTKFSDDYLWMPYVVHKYIAVTGDFSILEAEVGFIEGQSLEENQHESYIVPNVSTRVGTIYDHCVIALDRALKFGSHGLPFIGCGDWNDGMNEVGMHGQGESVWLAWFLADILKNFSQYVAARRDQYRADDYLGKSKQLVQAVEQNAWDGNWYIRAFFDDGTPLGSHNASECKIDSLAQSWSIITGLGNSERGKTAMDNVYRELVDRENHIIKLLTPPFDTSEPRPGYIAGYLPGIRENGAQYTHAAVWVIMASAMMGKGNLAFELYSLINPVNLTSDKESVGRYQGEPYVTCGDVYSVSPHGGRAGWSWYTGSASWLYLVGIETILGLKAMPDGFLIDPCVPSGWDRFSLKIKIRGRNLNISVQNPKRIERGVLSLKLNGIEVPSKKLSFEDLEELSETQTHEVELVMGA